MFYQVIILLLFSVFSFNSYSSEDCIFSKSKYSGIIFPCNLDYESLIREVDKMIIGSISTGDSSRRFNDSNYKYKLQKFLEEDDTPKYKIGQYGFLVLQEGMKRDVIKIRDGLYLEKKLSPIQNIFDDTGNYDSQDITFKLKEYYSNKFGFFESELIFFTHYNKYNKPIIGDKKNKHYIEDNSNMIGEAILEMAKTDLMQDGDLQNSVAKNTKMLSEFEWADAECYYSKSGKSADSYEPYIFEHVVIDGADGITMKIIDFYNKLVDNLKNSFKTKIINYEIFKPNVIRINTESNEYFLCDYHLRNYEKEEEENDI